MAKAEEGKPASAPGDTPGRWRSWWWALALLGTLVVLWRGFGDLGAGRTIPYSEFERRLDAGELAELQVGSQAIVGTLQEAPAQPAPEAQTPVEPKRIPFRTLRVEDPELVTKLRAAKVEFSGLAEDGIARFLFVWLLPLALVAMIALLLFSSMRRSGTQMLGFGRSQARLAPESGTGVTFDDVAGCEEAKSDLTQMVEFLRSPERFTALGAQIPKGVLLLGPPGTGKTLLARAVAGEARVPFFSITGSDFVEMFVGVGAARVRDLFAQAKPRAPCIVFIDEIDAVGRQRGVSMGVVNDEREQTLNQLLAEMDGFEANSGVIVLAATNRPEVLDRALLRPGRFDRQVVLDAPDVSGREAILRVHARRKPMAGDVDLRRIAQATPGMSGADLANALNEAALAAAQESRREITQSDLEQAIERIIAGPERRSRILQPDEKRRVACHEAGHALVTAYCEHVDPVRKISVVPRGRSALGFTLTLPTAEQFLRTRIELVERLNVLLAGRAAEEVALGDASTGAQDDLESATALARQMVCVLGMSERIGLAHCAREAESSFSSAGVALVRDCSEDTAHEIDQEVRQLLDHALRNAKAILSEHREEFERVVARLLEVETLDAQGFEAARRGQRPTKSTARPEAAMTVPASE